jgi:hypothetical protein
MIRRRIPEVFSRKAHARRIILDQYIRRGVIAINRPEPLDGLAPVRHFAIFKTLLICPVLVPGLRVRMQVHHPVETSGAQHLERFRPCKGARFDAPAPAPGRQPVNDRHILLHRFHFPENSQRRVIRRQRLLRSGFRGRKIQQGNNCHHHLHAYSFTPAKNGGVLRDADQAGAVPGRSTRRRELYRLETRSFKNTLQHRVMKESEFKMSPGILSKSKISIHER